MLLAVDTGNTHTVLGLFEGHDLRADWRIPTRKDTTVDELGKMVVSRVQMIDGITRTLTCPVVHL